MREIIPKNAVLVPAHAECVFKGHIFDTYQWEEKMFDGSFGTFEMLKRLDSVEVLVVHENKILVQKQEQPFRGSFLSFPGGRHDHADETEQEGCARELREETGFTCENYMLVSVVQRHMLIESFLYTFIATEIVGQIPTQLDSGEKIENIWMTLDEVRALIPSGKFRSSAHQLFGDAKEAHDLLLLPEYTV